MALEVDDVAERAIVPPAEALVDEEERYRERTGYPGRAATVGMNFSRGTPAGARSKVP